MVLELPATGRYRTELDRNIEGGRKIARAEPAAEMLARLDDSAAYGHTVGLAYWRCLARAPAWPGTSRVFNTGTAD